MAETVGGVKMSCSDTCGCPVPCPGGESCRCTDKTEATSGGGHKTCSCGEHCGCNPCTCDRGMVATGVGKANCRCAEGCTCVSCSA